MFVPRRGMCMFSAQKPPECKIRTFKHLTLMDGSMKPLLVSFPLLPQCIFTFFPQERMCNLNTLA